MKGRRLRLFVAGFALDTSCQHFDGREELAVWNNALFWLLPTNGNGGNGAHAS